jgi:hypothetical protein
MPHNFTMLINEHQKKGIWLTFKLITFLKFHNFNGIFENPQIILVVCFLFKSLTLNKIRFKIGDYSIVGWCCLSERVEVNKEILVSGKGTRHVEH